MERVANIDVPNRTVGANSIDETIERRRCRYLRGPVRQMLGIDRRLVRRDHHDVADAARREEGTAARELRDDGAQLRVRYRKRAAIETIERRAILTHEIEPAVAADQHVRRRWHAEEPHANPVVCAEQRLAPA